MLNILSFIVIVIFVPLIVFAGFKVYKNVDYKKFYNVFSLVLFSLELLRFFYNAALYEKAATPASEMKLSYITFLSVFALFGAFNKGRIGVIARRVFVLTSLFPLIIGLFTNKVYTNVLDVHSVIKALYFVECGMIMTLALCFIKEIRRNFSLKPIFGAIVWTIAYIGINGLFGYLWKNYEVFTLNWGIMVLVLLVSVVIVAIIQALINKYSKNNINND